MKLLTLNVQVYAGLQKGMNSGGNILNAIQALINVKKPDIICTQEDLINIKLKTPIFEYTGYTAISLCQSEEMCAKK